MKRLISNNEKWIILANERFKRSCLNSLSIFCSKYKVLMFFVRINCTKAIFSAMPTAPPLPQLGGYQDIGFGLRDAGLWVFAIWLLEYNLWMLIKIHPKIMGSHKTGRDWRSQNLAIHSQTPVFWRFQWLLGHEIKHCLIFIFAS